MIVLQFIPDFKGEGVLYMSSDTRRDNDRKKYIDGKRKSEGKNAGKMITGSTKGRKNVRNIIDKQKTGNGMQNVNHSKKYTAGSSKNLKNYYNKNTGCKYIKECGGCNYQMESYELELSRKQKLVNDLLKSYCNVEPIIRMEQPYNYRNKVHVVFDHDKQGNPISGVYEEGTHNVIPIESCKIHNKKADEIIASIRGMLKSFKIKTYDEDTGYGLLRHVLIRAGYNSGEILVVLVLSSSIMPSKNNFVKALLKQHPEITSIVINVNNKKTSMVLGEKEQVIYGKGYIIDKLCGKTFKISPKSFYQVNPVQTEILYNKAIEYANLTGNETVIDAYCGIGTIGLIAADHAKEVIGVELNKDAVKDAINNAKLNNTSNIFFIMLMPVNL